MNLLESTTRCPQRCNPMHVDHQREKFVQTVVFFAKSVRKLGKTKLFKLLYFADFMHYRDTGRSVTGMDYFAWKMGPVPVSLFEEIRQPQPDLAACVEFRETSIATGQMLAVRAKCVFDSQHFSKRELRILNQLAEEFKDATADEMVEKTHLENSPWHKVWDVEGRRQAQISYDLALRGQDREAIQSLVDARAEFLSAFQSE